MKTVRIDENIKRLMIQHARTTYPEECCGFLFGNDTPKQRIITKAIKAENMRTDNKKRRFAISPQDYMQAEQYASTHHLTLLGIYHSHPNHPAEPSEHDRQQAMPFFSYIILSVEEEQVEAVTSWQLNDERQFEREKIIFEPLSTIKT